MRRGVDLQGRLAAVRSEIAEVREQLRVLEAQVAYQQEVTDDAVNRGLVGGPLDAREGREAQRDGARLHRARAEVQQRLAALAQQQDDLLEQLFAQSAGAKQ